MKLSRDWLSDCRACEINDAADYLRYLGDDEAAVAAAAPVLDGTLRCNSEPHGTLADVLEPLVRLGRTPRCEPRLGGCPGSESKRSNHLLEHRERLPAAIRGGGVRRRTLSPFRRRDAGASVPAP